MIAPVPGKSSAKRTKAAAASAGLRERSAKSGRYSRRSSGGGWRSRIVESSVPRDSRSAVVRQAGAVVKTDATIADD